MSFYGVDPLVHIHVDDVVTTFYPSRIDNSKVLIGCKNSIYFWFPLTIRFGCDHARFCMEIQARTHHGRTRAAQRKPLPHYPSQTPSQRE